ncbi:hypothetical protein [Caulobacter vibrioides]|uniref:Uncharacterized protein n=2 Tax=Caulobacter vibrioides TaxID=155892 RepID=Q9A573_CAUVC|nr:hypothetical protein [Caulobacter vibrioides]YP_002518045.1 hypothetical protein CCNA_02672 [Caulobacter vibrioides NA1000]AAK24559.1 hypothetical protein CC_2589 [Caulobacter vibrioides CB15]ACL96137.1 hypothetical protein CCNA_02672 [Caulobacter vibrioides NA1000]ATC29439.1 hypothetical protein CA607_14005 [Caulobacter vibrioides]QXZ50953.1 hypothetical protein KZH45_13760 [Caulobacter vibrioides]
MSCRLLLVLATFAALVSPAIAEEQSALNVLDLNKAQNWAEALAACDVTRFLLTDPDVTASTIIAPGEGAPQFLYPPLFTPPNVLYTPSLLRTFEILQARGEVDRKSLADARFRFANAVVPSFQKGDAIAKAVLSDQMKLCNVLTDGVASEAPRK